MCLALDMYGDVRPIHPSLHPSSRPEDRLTMIVPGNFLLQLTQLSTQNHDLPLPFSAERSLPDPDTSAVHRPCSGVVSG